MRGTTLILMFAAFLAAPATAQQPSAAADLKRVWTAMKNTIVKAADKMLEENYAFKPAPEVRGFGQLIGHIADAQNMICSAAKGEKNPAPGIEKSKTSKSDLMDALKQANAYCDSAYDALADGNLNDPIKLFGSERSRAGVLNMNVSHTNEHYGNLVTYMRIKGLVPPTSEARPRQ